MLINYDLKYHNVAEPSEAEVSAEMRRILLRDSC